MGRDAGIPRWDPIPVRVILLMLAEQSKRNEPWPEGMAYLSIQRDYREGQSVSVSGYAALWGWSRSKVRRYLDSVGAVVNYNECTKMRQNQRGQITIRPRTDRGQTMIINFGGLHDSKDRSRSDNKQKKGTTSNTDTNTNTTPPTPPNETGGRDSGVGGSSVGDQDMERYLRLCVRVPPGSPVAPYLAGARRRILDAEGLNPNEQADLAEAERRLAQASAKAVEREEAEAAEKERALRLAEEEVQLWEAFLALPEIDRRRIERQAQQMASPGGPAWRAMIAAKMRNYSGPAHAGEAALKLIRGR